MSISTVTTDDLRRMNGKEGLVLQGCGGDPQEWLDGINGLLTDEGILKNGSKFDPLLVTRRTLFWGAVTAAPIVLAEGTTFSAQSLLTPAVAGNFLFLGLIGSGLCYVLWNHAIRLLGVVTTNNFIYLVPFVTIVAASIFLRESISPLALLGAVLITAGVVLAQRKPALPASASQPPDPSHCA